MDHNDEKNNDLRITASIINMFIPTNKMLSYSLFDDPIVTEIKNELKKYSANNCKIISRNSSVHIELINNNYFCYDYKNNTCKVYHDLPICTRIMLDDYGHTHTTPITKHLCKILEENIPDVFSVQSVCKLYNLLDDEAKKNARIKDNKTYIKILYNKQ